MERRHRQVERQRNSSGGAIRAAAPPSGPERDTRKPTLTRRSGEGAEAARLALFARQSLHARKENDIICRKIGGMRQIAASGFVYLHVGRFQRALHSRCRQGASRRCTEHRAASPRRTRRRQKGPRRSRALFRRFLCVFFSR